MEVVGIDFGTTNVRISIWDTDSSGLPQPCLIGREDPENQEIMPAVVALQRQHDGYVSVVVGEDAVALKGEDNALVIHNIKRWALSSDPFMRWQMDVKGIPWPTWWNPESRCVEMWGEQFPVKDLISRILEEAIARASLPDKYEWRAGCPVHAGLDYRTLLGEVLTESAGNGSLNWVVDEPVLFLTLLWRMGSLEAGSYLVYDLGGGSFDCAVVEVRENGDMIVYGADGHPLLGGADILGDVISKLGLSGQEASGDFDPGFLSGDVYSAVIKEGRYIERSMMSLRDAYSSAKVVWGRNPDDYPFGETVFENSDTGEIRFVWQLGYADMAKDLDAVILFGGPTRNTVFAESLGKWFGEDKIKLTSELVNVRNSEFTALSMGACYFSQQEDLTENYSHMVPSRLPINVTLENLHTGEKVEYIPHQHFGEREQRKFDSSYNFFGSYTSQDLRQDQDNPAEYMLTVARQDGLVLQDSNGEDLQLKFNGFMEPRKLLREPGDRQPATSLRLIIDRLGYLWVEMKAEGVGLPWTKLFRFPDIVRGPDDLPPSPPWQTEAQREAWKRIQERIGEQEEKRRLRLVNALNRPAHLEVN